MSFPTQIKKKFFYRNLLEGNQKGSFLEQFHLSEHNNRKLDTEITINKPIFSGPSTSLKTLNKSERPIGTSTQRFYTQTSQQQLKTSIQKRAPLHKRTIDITPVNLHITEYLDYLGSTRQIQTIKRSQLLKEETQIKTLLQERQQNYKKQKEDSKNNLQLLYSCNYAIKQLKEGVPLHELLNSSYSITNQSQQIQNMIQQFMQDIDLAYKLYQSIGQLGAVLARVTGMDYRIFYMLFRPKQEYPEINTQFNIDESFTKNYIFTKPTLFDIYYRIFGAGQLPIEFQDQLGINNPNIKKYKFKQLDHQLAQNNIKIQYDNDFVKKLTYFQKNLQLSLKQKQIEIFGTLKQQLSDQETKNSNVLRQSILSKLIESENQIGQFPLVSRHHRFQFEKSEYDQRILNKHKQ